MHRSSLRKSCLSFHAEDKLTFYSHITTNPTSYIVAVAEQAAAKILALK
jgi:cellobiose dehydrogenase (acceptor)